MSICDLTNSTPTPPPVPAHNKHPYKICRLNDTRQEKLACPSLSCYRAGEIWAGHLPLLGWRVENELPESPTHRQGAGGLNDPANFAPSVLFEDDTKLNPYAEGDGKYKV